MTYYYLSSPYSQTSWYQALIYNYYNYYNNNNNNNNNNIVLISPFGIFHGESGDSIYEHGEKA
jgi:hypothetical protein